MGYGYPIGSSLKRSIRNSNKFSVDSSAEKVFQLVRSHPEIAIKR